MLQPDSRKNILSDTDKEVNASILALTQLTIQRGEFPLCSGVNLTLNKGDICHLIGANGTGKTTLMMQLVGLLPVLTGKVMYQGQNSLPIAPLYVSHQLGIHPNLSVAQNLTFLLNLYGVTPTEKQIEEALTWVGLAGYERVSSNQLSAGQTRRITLARLYLLSPSHTPLWLLDEPFTALDVAMVDALQQRLQEFASLGGAVLMTSHQKVTVATMCLDLSLYPPDEELDMDEYEYDIDDEDSRHKHSSYKTSSYKTSRHENHHHKHAMNNRIGVNHIGKATKGKGGMTGSYT